MPDWCRASLHLSMRLLHLEMNADCPHPHRRPHIALHADFADTVDLRQFRLQQRVRRIRHPVQGNGVRGQRQRHDRRIGRVHLGINRWVGQCQRQRAGRRVDRRLHILRRAVDVARQRKLQGDLARPLRGGGGHHRQPLDLAELPLQAGSDQIGHHIRAGAGHLGGNLDGREIDLRQGGNRQGAIAHRPGQQHRNRQQRGGDRPGDEGGGDIQRQAVTVSPGDGARAGWQPAWPVGYRPGWPRSPCCCQTAVPRHPPPPAPPPATRWQ